MTYNIVDARTLKTHYSLGSRPFYNTKTGEVFVKNERNMVMNSVLTKDEWEDLDAVMVQAAAQRLNAVAHLFQRGLTRRLGHIGKVIAQYNVISQMTAASVQIEPDERGSRDRTDKLLKGTTVPVISKNYDFGIRELTASRMDGTSLDTSEASAAARVVAEGIENMLINGNTTVSVNNAPIYGYRTHPNRKTGSGSSWGTAGNAVTDVSAMINLLQGSNNNHFGPYNLYASTVQFNELSQVFFTDGSGDNQMDRIMKLTGIAGVYPSDWIPDGEAVLVEMSRDVVQMAFVPGFGVNVTNDGRTEVTGVTNLEWTSGSGMTSYHKALAVMVPIIKADYDNKSGIAHYTGL